MIVFELNNKGIVSYKMSTLKDVARLAGVTPSTVSYVLNNKKKVKEDTKRRIYKAVDELNYSPNMIARSLRTNSTKTIGVIVASLSDLFFSCVVRAIENEAHKYNYSVILCNTDNSAEREIEKINILLSQRIDGMIFAGTGRNMKPFSEGLNVPMVSIDRIVNDCNCSITVDNAMGGRLAAEFLIKNELMPMAIITYTTTINTFFDRVYGCRKALEEHGIGFNENLLIQTELASYNEGYDAAIELLRRNVEFKSVFCCNDLLAVGAMRAFIENKMEISKDVSIIGYDDIDISKMLAPSLTTIRQPKHGMGELAVKTLIKLMNGEVLEQSLFVLEPELVVRESAVHR